MTLADTKTRPWPQDLTQVDVQKMSELKFWSEHFRVSPGKLKQTVRAVGSKFKDVEKHINSRR